MFEIGVEAFEKLAAPHRERQIPRFAHLLEQALTGERGRALGIQNASALQRESLVAVVEAAERLGLTEERDVVAFGLLTIPPKINLPIETAEWIGAIVADPDSTWTDKLDAIHALLPKASVPVVFG